MFITLAPPTSHAPMWAVSYSRALRRHVGYREGVMGGGGSDEICFTSHRSFQITELGLGLCRSRSELYKYLKLRETRTLKYCSPKVHNWLSQQILSRGKNIQIIVKNIPVPRADTSLFCRHGLCVALIGISINYSPFQPRDGAGELMASKYGKKNWHSWLRVLCYCLRNIFITSPCSKTENLQNSQNLSRIPPIWF